jgi:hypothetical protein
MMRGYPLHERVLSVAFRPDVPAGLAQAACLQEAVDAASQAGGGVVSVGPGRYVIFSNCVVNRSLRMIQVEMWFAGRVERAVFPRSRTRRRRCHGRGACSFPTSARPHARSARLAWNRDGLARTVVLDPFTENRTS